MTAVAPAAPPTAPTRIRARQVRGRESAFSFEGLLLLTVAIRIAAHFATPQSLQSDGLAYYTLAANLAGGHWPVDNLGQHAFYSIGYPLVLAPAFALIGASVGVAFLVNLLLAAVSAMLVRSLARALGMDARHQQLAMLGHALWLPGIWNCLMLARENVSTPLTLALMLLGLRIMHEGPRLRLALMTGLVWGAAVLAGNSALVLVAAPLLALGFSAGWHPRRLALRLSAPVLALAAGAALMIAPWTMATQYMLGRPVLTTNGGFNLYLGNNPSATGRYLSIAKTPAGPGWLAMRAKLGEVDASARLGQQAKAWIAANPQAAARLASRKLALFWAPNLPSRADFATSRAMAIVRLGEVSQYVAFLLLGLAGLIAGTAPPRRRLVIGAPIAAYWLLHGMVYIIPRYRDPIMPILIIFAAGIAGQFLTARPAQESPHAV